MIETLGRWIAANVHGASGDIAVEQLAGGSSNLTYRVRDGDHDWVLRRPPEGRTLATANDVHREYVVQRALRDTDVPVAEVVAHCADDSVIGAPFYLMQHVEGVVYAEVSDVEHLDAAQSLAASYELIDVLAAIHRVVPAEVGLDEFGRPEGFAARQVERWSKQWKGSATIEVPEIDEVVRRLGASVPEHPGTSIVHGDYSFNNTMFSADDPTRMVAVLDWEMSTLGDPLTDLGMVAVYWADAGALLWRDRDPQPHRANVGFPAVDALLDRYADQSGRDLTDIDFYRALATFKLAAITQGFERRIPVEASEQRSRLRATVQGLATLALDAADSLASSR